MAHDVTLPALGESVTEGTVTRWLKKVGDTVAVDEPLLEISTDKVDTEIPSPVAGTVTEILVPEDETVEVGAVLARIGGEGESPAPSAPAASAPEPAPAVAAAAAPETPSAPPETPAAPPETAPAAPEATSAAPAPAPTGGGSMTDVTLPALGESVTEGTVTRWLKKAGDSIAVDEPLLEISTDKVDTEVPSPVAGTVAEIVVAEDQTVAVGAVLARIATGGAALSSAAPSATLPAAAAPAPAAPAPPAPAATPVTAAIPMPVVHPAPVPAAPAPAAAAMPTPATPAPAPSPSASTAPAANGGGYVTPIVRKLAAERGVDLAALQGTGVGGRIRKEDVLAAKPSSAAAGAPAAQASPLRGTTVEMSRLRSIIASRMMESLHGMAQLTTVIEVDMTRVWALRAAAKEAFEKREGAKLTFLPFFTKAAAEALVTHAALNASITGTSVTYHGAVHLGIAVDTEKGLIVPALKNADTITLADHARGIADLGARARDNKLTPDDLAGATFTVTNTGSIGALFDTPIVPSPQVAILGTGAITKKPVVVSGPDGGEVIAIRPMCYLSLSYDHRIVDGADASRFLQAVRARIEAGLFEAEVGL